ncbi:MAG: restriction endonuclease [Anaerolineaceae bacterium]|nr:restriction endonuclease [Anaerolineaceae bacterium]
MAIPDFQSIMLPLLQHMGDGIEHSNQEITNCLAQEFKLSQGELDELLPSGKQSTFYNRAGWARTYLAKSGLIRMTKKPFYQITERGKAALQQKPARIDIAFLKQYPEFVEFRERKEKEPTPPKVIGPIDPRTPEEIFEDAYQEIRENLILDALSNVKNCSPSFFERLVVELLVKMGYGGSQKEAARAVGKSGDGGIDGIIDEDRLGLDAVYIQAKRWEGVVSRPEIQKFVGALMGRKARKGIFITTSTFSSEAIKFVATIDYKIVLIDGKRLAEFTVDYDIGVTVVSTYMLKKIDTDYFTNG